MNIIDRPDLQRAADLFANACRISRRHDEEAAEALRTYGAHGPDIAGCVRDHFPQSTRDHLRSLARDAARMAAAAYAARPPRVRMSTMRALAQAVARRDGSGYYGPQS